MPSTLTPGGNIHVPSQGLVTSTPQSFDSSNVRMHTRATQVILLVFSLILAIFILIAASKYAAWAHVMTTATGDSLALVLYIGTIPLFSLLYTTAHLATLHFDGLPIPQSPGSGNHSSVQSNASDADYTATSTFIILLFSILHFLVWLLESILCTSCELAPILAGTEGRVPRWCPQSRFKDSGQPNLANMLATLATVKDFTQWMMVLITISLIECARREYMRAEHVRSEAFRREGTDLDVEAINLTVAKISGPRLLTAEEIAAQQQLKDEEEARKQKEEQERQVRMNAPRQPMGPGVPGNTDNYYGNGMTLKRSGTLNYMYESRI
ncbi:hypothetical protein LTR10_016109 [Elasticomyces elasticus]|uniref:MARVEL domain-containing protein n=1 Tax=Exophiala sideris TaxID=1016849 RepID=A0ABR0IX37_9EURO|nr:hypothetical protein LTR10_016109 [Elasticomyces elasticus]KAK5021522.1 hypothetical protein LTS07_010929 [Exophiala sideris]KAK5024558.1 hypothetical protein LTR13_010814 [Exophiala sideris]KAK5049657.1 hypothetical protein LTR69_010953 [Exophiala sideris]KAK5176638.1 hypothetical protein LTR44_010820 [Eurotiomycetes sp. CCFEE 6388]